MLKKVRIKNFKSFKDVEIEFGKLNVLVGANASGKTNFLAYLEFMKEIVHKDKPPDLSRAILNQCGMAGIDYFLNKNLGTEHPFETEIVFRNLFPWILWNLKPEMLAYLEEETYSFKLSFNAKNKEYIVLDDRFIWKCGLDKAKHMKEDFDIDPNSLTKREIILKRENGGKREYYEVKSDGNLEASDILKSFRDYDAFEYNSSDSSTNRDQKRSKQRILLERAGIFQESFRRALIGISTYDFQFEHRQQFFPITNFEKLSKEGSNLTLVLAFLMQEEEDKRALFNLLSYVFPFFEKLEIREVAEKHIELWMKEEYQEAWFPWFLLSEGTRHIIALIVALFFDKSKIVFIEEPDRYLHPYLISALVELMKDASRNKQIFITTHNPEVLRHVDKEDILLVSRDEEGFSTITRPANSKKIKTFLKNNLGMADLFIDNILDI